MNIKNSVTETIGATPMIRLQRLEKEAAAQAELIAKVEFFNPTSSAKDRPALEMIDRAVADGLLPPGGTIIEPTSGNTGVGLAAIAAARGYRAIIVMADSMSMERRKLMAAFGAELVLTPGALGMQGCVDKARELQAQIPGSFIPDQFGNPANADAHYKTTGPEIWKDTEGQVDILVASVGTGGTLTGTASYLKEQLPGLKAVAVEPTASPLLSQGRAGSHKIQGIGANFVPEVLDRSLIDE
ncbi:MAG: pyridoxal-phosphate dependent enzyme, partial [Oscillospiraceae bacterium]|nr:pyridoxal-phosphate dependent enzyme [Oscillospiraceae bacterium]